MTSGAAYQQAQGRLRNLAKLNKHRQEGIRLATRALQQCLERFPSVVGIEFSSPSGD